MLVSTAQSDLTLVKAVLSGDSKAANRLLDAVSTTLWTVVVRLEGEGQKGEAAFLEVVAGIKADGFRRLQAFDGRARITTYLAIVARDILADRLAASFISAPSEVWTRFERFFGDDIRRRVVRRFPRDAGTAAR